MTETILAWTGLFVALVIDLLAAAARASLLNTSLSSLLGQGTVTDPALRQTLGLLHRPARLQLTFNLLQNLLRLMIVAALLILLAGQPLLSSPSMLALVLLLLALAFTWLEWLARSLATIRPAAWALRLTPFARVCIVILSPLVSLTMAFTGADLAFAESSGSVVVDELKSLVDAGQQGGVLELGERKMIYSIFELGDTLVREIMVPRIDVFAMNAETPLTDAIDALLESGYTRVPVYEDTIDHIIGLLYSKDLLRMLRQGDDQVSLSDLVRPAYFVPEAKKADELMAEMQSQRIHMAIIVDEYGGVAGLVTLEDIVEEILGEIQDEYDQGEESPYVAMPDGEFLFLGKIDLDDFNEIMGSNLSKDEADTLGGFIYSQVGRVPGSGEHVQIDDLLLTVEQVSGRRIRKVRAERLLSQANPQEQTGDANG